MNYYYSPICDLFYLQKKKKKNGFMFNAYVKKT